jgi:chemotaxis methyl-accepting protein methylase
MIGATEALRRFVRNRAGINLGADKDYLVISRLKPLLCGWNVTTLDALAERLRAEPRGPLADQVIAALTINETLWFRDNKPFEALRNVIIPELAASSFARSICWRCRQAGVRSISCSAATCYCISNRIPNARSWRRWHQN